MSLHQFKGLCFGDSLAPLEVENKLKFRAPPQLVVPVEQLIVQRLIVHLNVTDNQIPRIILMWGVRHDVKCVIDM